MHNPNETVPRNSLPTASYATELGSFVSVTILTLSPSFSPCRLKNCICLRIHNVWYPFTQVSINAMTLTKKECVETGYRCGERAVLLSMWSMCQMIRWSSLLASSRVPFVEKLFSGSLPSPSLKELTLDSILSHWSWLKSPQLVKRLSVAK